MMTKIKQFTFLFLIILIGTTGKNYAQSLETKIDDLILKELKDSNGPGGLFMVAHRGKMIYQKGFGKANIELGANIGVESVFQLGSMTKQFTAIAILMLEEQGKLRVKHPISKYIPDYPQGDKITIHHLLTHTSGIKDFTRMKTLSEIAQKEMSPKMMVDFFKNEPVDFAPGEKFEYNNSGYVVLGYLIELISGQTYESFIQNHIFNKLGMSKSRYASDRQVVLNRAYGYQKKENGYVNKTVINFSVPYSSGALMSTITDLLKWQNALNTNKLLGLNETKKAFARYRLNSGEEFSYGYGWHIKELNGIASREHGGSIFGFKSMGVYLPEVDIYVVGLTNCDCNSPTQLARDIASLAHTQIGQKR